MKFENPSINISMFNMENVVTDSTNLAAAQTAAVAAIENKGAETTRILTFTF